LDFQRPSRYINKEVNAIYRDAPLKVALAFPDIYDIGMSHLGLRILYDIINAIPQASAERVFHPWLDMEEAMKAGGIRLGSLESGRPLGEFDIAGFSLQHELSYTSVLNMIKMGGIPLRAAERQGGDPLVIAGGPCTVNPMPMSPFIDAFLVGDGEDAIRDIVDTVLMWKTGGDGRRDPVLNALSEIEGVYVPSVPKKVRRRIVASLEDAPYPISPVVPYTEIVHDRLNIEVSRGCPMGCRFCQAGIIYRPVRERSPERVLEIAERSLGATGFEEVAFTSLSAGDYSCLEPLIRGFNRKFSEMMVSVSLPSLRVRAVNAGILRAIRAVRKTGFTIAPEAATERLRGVINKDFSQEDFDEAVRTLFSEGWQNIKLYYMIGLPGERDEDIEAIVPMVKDTQKTARKFSARRVNISVSVSPFVPKPHTPFQWHPQADTNYINEKKSYLRRKLGGVNLKGHNENMSLLEGAFARGDERLSELLEAALGEGARLDGWTEAFDFDLWRRAMDLTGIDAAGYCKRQFGLEEPLPWDTVDTGVKKEYLRKEYLLSEKAEITVDCRASCTACGLGCDTGEEPRPADVVVARARSRETTPRRPVKIRVEFSKTGPMRYLSHRETMTHIVRALRRTGVLLVYSQGFHPSPKVAFGPPLGVGVAGLREYFDMEVYPTIAMAEIRDMLNSALSDGFRVNTMASVDMKSPSLQGFVSRYVYEIIFHDGREAAAEGAERFMQKEKALVSREKGQVDIRKMVKECDITGDGGIRLTVMDVGSRKVRLEEIIGTVFDRRTSGLDITRLALFGKSEGRWVRPLEVNG
jgi:radical SAM family uncharacterized protein/radical SAM-linked protein